MNQDADDHSPVTKGLQYRDAVDSAGGRGATFDLFPSEDVAETLEHFWAEQKVVGAICHGAIALGNVPDRIRGRMVTGYTLEGDQGRSDQLHESHSKPEARSRCSGINQRFAASLKNIKS
jgi:putative intracellular protease/amidase